MYEYTTYLLGAANYSIINCHLTNLLLSSFFYYVSSILYVNILHLIL